MSIQDSALDEGLTHFAFTQPSVPVTRQLTPLPELLGGRYHLETLLGVGGMGAVYRARDLLREQYGDPAPHVAIKVLNDDFAEYNDANALLYGEFALTVRLRHPHIVRLHGFEVDRDSERAFITLELMRGPTLDTLLCDRPDGLSWSELQEIAVPLLEALQFAHANGVLHGDIKPSNVILTDSGLRLFDFGLGQPCEDLLPGLPRLSRGRFNAWTVRYAPLELLEDGLLTPAGDLYACACVLYELATGKHPYRRLSAKQARSMQIEPERPRDMPVVAWQLLRRALEIEPTQRQQDLGEWLAHWRITAPPARRWWHRLLKRST
ncbi:serine/threonine protein kinase [Pseudomonas oryzihabitans]|nr:serine/threonine protein kinase [Pseudomonas psychrotolerans]KTT38218.1 serine/threonine protein kinase [Pseudomonas psychrotolerans]KTT45392.1 serine/threonine protein kinase [Pseudomonas psychrotolerans]KTT67209.1 serine/threonine protein kinase [Pseudomonas psychrotolerans]